VSIEISLRSNMQEFTKKLDAFAQKQVPFASALALTSLARIVQKAETDALKADLDRPTPFTMKAFSVTAATKVSQTAVVFAKDVQAAYLAPVELGSRQLVKKTALTMPIDIATNTYGNIPKGALQRLKGSPNVFIGKVKTKDGLIGGVWQRVGGGTIIVRGKKRGQRTDRLVDGKDTGSLKLLIRFTDPVNVKPKLHYRSRAATLIEANYQTEMSKALAKAMLTAK
jgi:hypothetical protein